LQSRPERLGLPLGLELGLLQESVFSQFRKEQIDLGNMLPICLFNEILLFLAFN